MKQRKPQPSPVGVVFRGHHEGRAGSVADAMRAMERNGEQKKPALKAASCRRPLAKAADTQKTNHELCERSEEANYERREVTGGNTKTERSLSLIQMSLM